MRVCVCVCVCVSVCTISVDANAETFENTVLCQPTLTFLEVIWCLNTKIT